MMMKERREKGGGGGREIGREREREREVCLLTLRCWLSSSSLPPPASAWLPSPWWAAECL